MKLQATIRPQLFYFEVINYQENNPDIISEPPCKTGVSLEFVTNADISFNSVIISFVGAQSMHKADPYWSEH